jgi:hypothetical protein
MSANAIVNNGPKLPLKLVNKILGYMSGLTRGTRLRFKFVLDKKTNKYKCKWYATRALDKFLHLHSTPHRRPANLIKLLLPSSAQEWRYEQDESKIQAQFIDAVYINFPKKTIKYSETAHDYGLEHEVSYKYTYFSDGKGGYNCAWVVNDSDEDDDNYYCMFKRGKLLLNCPEDPSGKHEYVIPSYACIKDGPHFTDEPYTTILHLNKMNRGSAFGFRGSRYSYFDAITGEQKVDYLSKMDQWLLLGENYDDCFYQDY